MNLCIEWLFCFFAIVYQRILFSWWRIKLGRFDTLQKSWAWEGFHHRTILFFVRRWFLWRAIRRNHFFHSLKSFQEDIFCLRYDHHWVFVFEHSSSVIKLYHNRMSTCKHTDSIINLVAASCILQMVSSFHVLISFRIDKNIFIVESGRRATTVENDLANRFGEEEIELFIISLK